MLKENNMGEVKRCWTDEQLQGEEVSKKDIIKFLHEHASFEVSDSISCGLKGLPVFRFWWLLYKCFQDNEVCFSFSKKQWTQTTTYFKFIESTENLNPGLGR